mgnify:CR=1 FL=1
MVLTLILASSLLISLIAFVGVICLVMKDELIGKIVLILMSLSAGTLMGGAFFHLIPEVAKSSSVENFWWIIGGFALFYLTEKVLQWHHCHKVKHERTIGYINLFGDFIPVSYTHLTLPTN